MKIAVIVPALDEVRRLAVLLPALVRRDDIDEIVVVDASRGDDAAAFYAARTAAQSSRVRCIGALRVGRAAQMNLGAENSDADILLFLHADSTLPDVDLRACLSNVVPLPGWGRFDVRLDGQRWWAQMIAASMNLRSRLTGIATGDQAIFVSRDLWRSRGGFRDMPLMEDVELSARLRRIARPACLRTKVTTSARRWERHGVIRTVVLMWRLRLMFRLGVDPARLARMYRHAR